MRFPTLCLAWRRCWRCRRCSPPRMRAPAPGGLRAGAARKDGAAQGRSQTQKPPRRRPPRRKKAAKRQADAGQGAVRRRQDAGAARCPLHRLLRQGLPRRRRGAAHRRPGLAGHAPLAQPQLGPSRPDRPGREARRRGQGARRLARPAGGRHLPAARRAHAHRPRQPPGGARRRRVAHADAGPAPHREGAGGAVRHLHAGRRPRLGEPQGVDRGPRAPPEARRLLPGRWSACWCTRPSRRRCARPPRTRRTATG